MLFIYHCHLTALHVSLFSEDTSVTLESIPEDMPAAGGKQGEYLDVAKKGGHKGY